MKSDVYYSFDQDPYPLNLKNADAIMTLLQGDVRDEDSDVENGHPGAKAFRKMKGNFFTAADMQAFCDYGRTLLGRADERISRLKEESVLPQFSGYRQQYEGVIGQNVSAFEGASRRLADFEEAVTELLQAPAPSM